MGRGKVVLKRIQDKSNRQVSFSKRRSGLLKKSHELTVLCDVDVAAFVFSDTGRLSEFSSGERMTNILTRYQTFKKTDELYRAHIHKYFWQKLASEYNDVCTADELTEMIQRHLEENNLKLLDEIGLDQLEKKLGSILQQVRIRKKQLNMEVLKALQDKEMELKKERNLMMQEIKQARMNGITDDTSNGDQRHIPVMDIQVIW